MQSRWRNIHFIFLCLWLSLFAGIAFAHGPTTSKPEFRRTPLEPPRDSLNFTLTDQFGKRVSLISFRGQVVALTFLYTYCPDVCPLVAQKMDKTRRLLGNNASRVVFLVVTVDPDRDTVKRLYEYSKKFDMLDKWHFLTGTEAELKPVWDYYWVGKVWKDKAGEIAHQAPVHLIDPEGKIRVVTGATFKPEDLAHDIEVLVQPYRVSNWNLRADVFFVVSLFGAVYVVGWLRLRRLNPLAVALWQLTLYLGGLTAVLAALVSPIDALAEQRLSMHMLQHLLLLMIAPLLLLLANPLPPLLWGSPRKVRLTLNRLLNRSSVFRSVLWVLTLLPVTWSLYVLNLWAWHDPALYQLALRNEWVHDLQHVLFFSTATLFWWPIVSPAPKLHGSISYAYRIVYLIAATLQNTLLGMTISFPERVIYPFYATIPQLLSLSPIHDQALGGGILWVSGHMYLIPILVLIYNALMREENAMLERESSEREPRAAER